MVAKRNSHTSMHRRIHICTKHDTAPYTTVLNEVIMNNKYVHKSVFE